MSECTSCKQHYYLVIDSTTDRPIVDVEAYLIARGHFPSVGHPGTYTKAEWHRRSNQDGKFSIPELWADEADVSDLKKIGYVRVRVSQMIRDREHPPEWSPNPTILYLTPQSEQRIAELRYLLEDSKAMMAHNKRTYSPLYAPFYSPEMIAQNYISAKFLAKTDDERNFNKSFCTMSADLAKIVEHDRGRIHNAKIIDELLTDCAAQ